MADYVLVPINGEYLALKQEIFEEALERGAELVSRPALSLANHHEKWLTVDQVAERTGVSRSYWYEACRTGECPSRKFGTAVRIPASFLDDIDSYSSGQQG